MQRKGWNYPGRLRGRVAQQQVMELYVRTHEHLQTHQVVVLNVLQVVWAQQRRGRWYWVRMWAAGQQSLPPPLSQPLISFFLRWTPNTLPSGDKYIFPLSFPHTCLLQRPFLLILLTLSQALFIVSPALLVSFPILLFALSLLFSTTYIPLMLSHGQFFSSFNSLLHPNHSILYYTR